MPKKILLVDDDCDDVELLVEGLSLIDPTLICPQACNGSDALNLLQTGLVPDLMFLDINMPKMGGWECLRILKNDAAYKDIAVLICSTSSLPKDINRAAEMGAWGFYTKPEDFKTLKQKLRIIMESFDKGNIAAQKFFNFNNIAG